MSNAQHIIFAAVIASDIRCGHRMTRAQINFALDMIRNGATNGAAIYLAATK